MSTPQLALEKTKMFLSGTNVQFPPPLNYIIDMETRKITGFHARFDFRKLLECYSDYHFLSIGKRRLLSKHPMTEVDCNIAFYTAEHLFQRSSFPGRPKLCGISDHTIEEAAI